MVTSDNELVTFEGSKELWREQLKSRVSTAPLVAGERVFVMGVDRAVHAFDAKDGKRLWTLQRPGEALTLPQTGVLAAFKDTLIAGQGPRLAGIDPTRGTLRWEVPVASPRGTNEVERLADLVGPARARWATRLCARSFQAAVGCVDADDAAAAVGAQHRRRQCHRRRRRTDLRRRRHRPHRRLEDAPTARPPGPASACCSAA